MGRNRISGLNLCRLSVILAAALMWSCSSGPDGTDSKVTITMVTHWGAGFQDMLIDYIDEYQRIHPNVVIEYRSVPYPDYLRYVIISHLSGESPDIYHLYSLWGGQLGVNGMLAVPPDSIRRFVTDNFTPSAVEGTTIDDVVYGIPTEVANLALFYRKDFLAEAGIHGPPDTWGELLDAARELTQYTNDGKIERAGFVLPRDWDTGIVLPFYAMVWSDGGTLHPAGDLDDPDNREIIENVIDFFVTLYDERICDASFSYSTFPRDLFNGRIAMALVTPDWENQLQSGMGDAFDRVGISPIPRGTHERISAGYSWFYAVDARSPVQDESWKFLHWLADRETGAEISRTGTFLERLGMLPSRNDDLKALSESNVRSFTLPFLESLPYTRAEPSPAEGKEAKTMLMHQIEYAMLGIRTPGETTARIVEKLKDLYDE
jgi:multiple sugar transport system substrate-binding protein